MPTAEGIPLSSWRDLVEIISSPPSKQVAELAERERAGHNPGMLLVAAREMAAGNLDDWL